MLTALSLLLLDAANPDTGDWGPGAGFYVGLAVTALVVVAAVFLFVALFRKRKNKG